MFKAGIRTGRLGIGEFVERWAAKISVLGKYWKSQNPHPLKIIKGCGTPALPRVKGLPPARYPPDPKSFGLLEIQSFSKFARMILAGIGSFLLAPQ
jgi:hypothetical protein